MKITILVVGKTDKGFVGQGVDEYLNRLKRYIKTDIVVLPDIKNSKNLSADQLILKEEELILPSIGNSNDVILLDEKGDEFTSMEFSRFIQGKMLSGTKEVVFVVGGAYGVSNAVKQRAQSHLALSKLTFSHQMVRLVLVEQIYRSMTILRGEPYHHQ